MFVDIDTQRDFLEPGGELYIPGSEAILGNLRLLTEHARTDRIPVLATACAHSLDDPELQVFPPHCLLGTDGQKRVAATAWPESRVLGPDERFEGGIPPHLTLEKRALDLFTHPDANRIIGLYAERNPLFVVYGVATDYCVRCAVLGLLERGKRVAVVKDAIHAIDETAGSWAIAEFVAEGAVMLTTEAVRGLG